MVSLRHSKRAIGDDNPDRQVGVQAWNDEHTLTGTAGTVLGFDSNGNATELTATAREADRTALAAINNASEAVYLHEAGCEGVFVWDSSNLSAKVTADTARGIYVAPTSDTTGASGAWVRKFSGAVNPTWFGVVAGDSVGANASANTTAWNAMIATLVTLAANTSSNFRGLYPVQFGLGTFEFNTLDLHHGSLIISGQGSGHLGTISAASTRLKFYSCTGIILQDTNTSGQTTKDGAAHFGSMGAAIRDLALEGNFTDDRTHEYEYHGILARCRFALRNVVIANFAGDGLRIQADTGSLGGNACDFMVTDLYAVTCRNGMWVIGNNGSAGTVIGGTFNNNREWGIKEGSFLGNAYIGCETASNGLWPENDGVTFGATMCVYSGNLYGAIFGQEAGASTNAPTGTTADNAYWYYISTGTVASGKPAWFSGMLVRAGGCLLDSGINSCNQFSGLYAEQNQGKAQLWQRSIVMGGLLSQWVWSSPTATHASPVVQGDDGTLLVQQSLKVTGGAVTFQAALGAGNTNSRIWTATHSTYAPSAFRLTFAGADIRMDYAGSSSNVPYVITGPSTTFAFGLSGATLPYAFAPGILVVPSASGAPSNSGRRLTAEIAIPTTGARAKGDLAWNSVPATAGVWGWRCTVSGTPGTWEGLYAMTAAQQSAFAAWTGTASRATKDTSTATTADIAQTLKALIDDLKARGVLA